MRETERVMTKNGSVSVTTGKVGEDNDKGR